MGERRPRKTSPANESKTNVRDVASSFVGRAADIAAIAERLEEGRLVTLVGPGGMGKTRVGLRFAEEQVGAYSVPGSGGTWFCDFTEARTVAGIVAVVAAALDVRLPKTGTDAALVEDMGLALARRGRVLLLFDNFEHLVSEAEGTLGRWITAARHAKFLVTSRAALHLPGEALWPLEPLPPDEARLLFLRRAAQVRPDVAGAGRDEEAAISEIVKAIGGMPLAIELAASRTAVLSLAQLRDRLERPLELLAKPGQLSGRHASLRGTVLDSVQLLSPAERAAFAACAIFGGGFTLEAAEAILASPGEEARSRSAKGAGALASVEALVRHSLLRAAPAHRLGGELRFSFFETIRDVAVELLRGDAAEEGVASRHARFYAELARKLAPDAAIRGSGEAFARIELELENLVHAHAHLTGPGANGDPASARDAVAIALALEPLLSTRGLSRLRLRLTGEAIGKLRGSPGPNEADLAAALLAQGLARRELGEMDDARADFEEALANATQARHHRLAALAHARIGEIVEIAGATMDAHAHFAESLALLEGSPNDELRRLNEAETYMRIGHAHRREGRLAAAESAVAEATRRYRLLDHGEGLAGALYESAVVAMFQGRQEAALARFDEGLEAARRADARAMAGSLTTARGGLLQEMGELDEALAHHAEAARVFRELGSRYRETSALYYLATAYLERGDAREAENVLLRALDAAESVGSPHYQALIEGSHAILLAQRGDLEACGRAMERAEKAQLACTTEPALAATIAIHAISCRACAWGVDTIDAEARAALERDASDLAIAHPSDDSRFALRMLLRRLRPASAKPANPSAALVVWQEGRGFRLPHARDAIDLSRRLSLKRILDLLARRRLDAPGEAVSLEEIVRAGWPGEQIGTLSALNRAHVALTTLRKLGLRDLLLTGAEGYWLDPAVAIRLEAGSIEGPT